MIPPVGLSIRAYGPIVQSGEKSLLDTLTPTNYSHEIAAIGGYKSSQISFAGSRDDLDEWFDRGLGRHIEVYDNSLVKIWEGFVNEINYQTGTLTASRGPLLNIGNRVKVSYQTVTYNTNPPIGGDPATTAVSNNTDSQTLYGIIEKALNAGTMNATEATQARDTFLTEYAWPETTQQINTQSTTENTITLSCLGYVAWLDTFYYSDTNSGTRQISTKIQDVLGADLNSIFSTDYSRIESNTDTVGRYDAEDRTGWAVIRDLIARGDASGNRYLFGIYNDRKASYGQIPSQVEYEYRLADPARRIFQAQTGAELYYWQIRPGKWLKLPDFLIGRVTTTPFQSDPRYIFIESVSYQLPWSISINGGKTNKLAQLLARKGLGGV